MNRRLTKEELIRLFEILIERDCPVYTHPEYRKHFNRDENLIINQITRHATTNVAYRSVDFDIENLTDEEFWVRIEGTKYIDLIENNAASAILSMAAKFKLLN